MAIDFEMDRKWVALFMIIAISFIITESGFIVYSTMDSRIERRVSLSLYYNKFSVYNINRDYGVPAASADVYYYQIRFGEKYAALTIQTELSIENGKILGVFSYIYNPSYTGNYIYSVGNASTLIRYDDMSSIIIDTTGATNKNPFILMAAIIPTGFNGVVPDAHIYADLIIL